MPHKFHLNLINFFFSVSSPVSLISFVLMLLFFPFFVCFFNLLFLFVFGVLFAMVVCCLRCVSLCVALFVFVRLLCLCLRLLEVLRFLFALCVFELPERCVIQKIFRLRYDARNSHITSFCSVF